MVEVFRIGAITFDDDAKLVVLTLPTNADDDDPITLHDKDGVDYQVPGSKKLIIGVAYASLAQLTMTARIGASDAADGPLTAEGVIFGTTLANAFERYEVMAAIPTGKYVTVESDSTSNQVKAGTSIYCVLLDA